MCGRYKVFSEAEVMEVRRVIQEISMRILHEDFEIKQGHNGEVRPTNKAPVIIPRGPSLVALEDLRWGFKPPNSSNVIINARVETLEERVMFSHLVQVGRCVVPAREYYEWMNVGRKEKIKHHIKDKSGNLLFMAGLYREAPDGDGREYVIITKDADGEVKKIHDRMPVLLRTDQIEPWFTGALTIQDISKASFNLDVEPCDGEFVQMSLDW